MMTKVNATLSTVALAEIQISLFLAKGLELTDSLLSYRNQESLVGGNVPFPGHPVCP